MAKITLPRCSERASLWPAFWWPYWPRWPASGPTPAGAGNSGWDIYEACEELVDLEDNFQLWRFRHLLTVQRTIGKKRGTGGSSGAHFLRSALDLTFFPELYAVRTEIKQG